MLRRSSNSLMNTVAVKLTMDCESCALKIKQVFCSVTVCGLISTFLRRQEVGFHWNTSQHSFYSFSSPARLKGSQNLMPTSDEIAWSNSLFNGCSAVAQSFKNGSADFLS